MRSKTNLLLSLGCLLALAGVGSAQTDGKTPPPDKRPEPNHSFALSPDGTRFVSRDQTGAVRQWAVRAEPSRLAQKMPLNAGDLAFSPNGTTLAEGGDGGVYLRNTLCGKGNRSLALEPGERVQALAFQPGGTLLAVAVFREASIGKCRQVQPVTEVLLYDLDTRKKVRTMPGGAALAFSADGKQLATGGQEANDPVRVYDVATGRALFQLTGPASVVKSLAFSPDGKLLAGHCAEGVQVWNAADGKQGPLIRPLRNAALQQFFFSPDSKRVYFSNGSGLMQYEVKKGFALAQLIPLEGARPLGFLADGSTLVLHRDNTLLLRDERGKMTVVSLQ